MTINRIHLIALLTCLIPGMGVHGAGREKPNLVVILTDDMGYGDLSCQGHPLIQTPHLDQLAAEGQRWTSFYASAPLCNPSRVAMMTGRMPIRIHRSDKNQWQHLPEDEITLAEMLKQAGYATAYVGKWGITNFTQPDGGAHPNDEGFDHFYGLVGSNDAPLRKGFARTYENIKNAVSEDFPISLYRQREAIETPVHQPTLTKRYTEESVAWIRERPEDEPFFLFLGHSMPHVPIYASDEFRGKSRAGLYGDVIEEIDWSVGEMVKALEEAGVAKDTLVLFTSDNGPWLTYYDLGGSPGPLRDGKITAWEGGVRVPLLASWPGVIPAGRTAEAIVRSEDFYPTILDLAGVPKPAQQTLDGSSFAAVLRDPSLERDVPAFFPTQFGVAVRSGDWKLILNYKDKSHELYNLGEDLSETNNLAAQHPERVRGMFKQLEDHFISTGCEMRRDIRDVIQARSHSYQGQVNDRPSPPQRLKLSLTLASALRQP